MVCNFLPIGVAALLVLLPACAPGPESLPAAPSSSDHAPQQHAHQAPRGGTLIELGEHAANLEVLCSGADGKLDLFVLDAHAENPIRLALPILTVQVQPAGGVASMVELQAVASPLTGETVGDTSAFSALVPELQGVPAFVLTVPRMEVRGVVYEQIQASVRPLADPSGAPLSH